MSAPSPKENVVEFTGAVTRPAPLTPAECDLRGMPFMPLDVVRLLDSDLFALSTGDEFKAAIAVWCKSWNQVPAASIPCDDRIVARLAGLSYREWSAVKATALRGWVLCDDGRLYHPVVAEKAIEAWAARERQRDRANRRWAKERTQASAEPPHGADASTVADAFAHAAASTAAHAPEMQGTGTGTGTVEDKSSEPKGSAPERGADDFDGRAWDAAVGLLTMDGRTSEKVARSFFGKLLSTHCLQARDLLPALMGAAVNGTQDAKAYLTKAAGHIAKRRTSGRQQDVDWC